LRGGGGEHAEQMGGYGEQRSEGRSWGAAGGWQGRRWGAGEAKGAAGGQVDGRGGGEMQSRGRASRNGGMPGPWRRRQEQDELLPPLPPQVPRAAATATTRWPGAGSQACDWLPCQGANLQHQGPTSRRATATAQARLQGMGCMRWGGVGVIRLCWQEGLAACGDPAKYAC